MGGKKRKLQLFLAIYFETISNLITDPMINPPPKKLNVAKQEHKSLVVLHAYIWYVTTQVCCRRRIFTQMGEKQTQKKKKKKKLEILL